VALKEEGVMKRLVEFPLEQGGSVLVQVDDMRDGPVTRGVRQEKSVAERTSKTFEEATESISPAAQTLINRLFGLQDPPDEINLEFGVQLSAEAGAFIATVAAEANFKVAMSWKARAGTTGIP
jgi:hypothetical protein